MLKAPNWPSKRQAIRYQNNIENISVDTTEIEIVPATDITKSVTTSKLWSLVSSVFRFASLTPTEPSYKTKSTAKPNNENESPKSPLLVLDSSPFIIKRCASFCGKL